MIIFGKQPLLTTMKPSADPSKDPVLNDPKLALPDRILLFAFPHVLSDALINLYTETYTLFTSLQRIFAASFRLPSVIGADVLDTKDIESLLGPPGAETVGHMRRLVMMYIEELTKLRSTPDVDVNADQRVSCFS